MIITRCYSPSRAVRKRHGRRCCTATSTPSMASRRCSPRKRPRNYQRRVRWCLPSGARGGGRRTPRGLGSFWASRKESPILPTAGNGCRPSTNPARISSSASSTPGFGRSRGASATKGSGRCRRGGKGRAKAEIPSAPRRVTGTKQGPTSPGSSRGPIMSGEPGSAWPPWRSVF
ncbi:hypothetical protein BDA96_03G305700 [Sorghum bicolor]|uniref:Uncharacterized protein n=1 Tax=Sorghum bicolor TaxID=4558 RepID=A0A921RHB6_SORBI|nr:hypothetical protein BDA96_03G305700 [Sorghum bicolor]